MNLPNNLLSIHQKQKSLPSTIYWLPRAVERTLQLGCGFFAEILWEGLGLAVS